MEKIKRIRSLLETRYPGMVIKDDEILRLVKDDDIHGLVAMGISYESAIASLEGKPQSKEGKPQRPSVEEPSSSSSFSNFRFRDYLVPSSSSLSSLNLRDHSQTSWDSSSDSSCTSSLSVEETKRYYRGLFSEPILVARSSDVAWQAPTGPEAYTEPKELRVVGYHALNKVWEDNVAFKVHAILDAKKVQWTSTDVVRIGKVGESLAPATLWIGVKPESLSNNDGRVVALNLRALLEKYSITDVDVEIRESIVSWSVGPKLLQPTFSSDRTVTIADPLTVALGLPICAQTTPWAEGTGGFFITKSDSNNNKLFLVTARHVVFFPPSENNNQKFERKTVSQPRYNVTLLGDAAYDKLKESIQTEIRGNEFMIEHYEKRLKAVEGSKQPWADAEREDAMDQLQKEKKASKRVLNFEKVVRKHWAARDSRTLGHVVLAPPIGVGADGYTEDFAIIEIDPSKIDASNFMGNVIDLGTEINPARFTCKMYPNPCNPTSFKYPPNRLLKLSGTISDHEMRHPLMLDQDDEKCLMVIKRGNTTGLTIGRANNIMSYTRDYFSDGNGKVSKEWAILPCDNRSGPFSARGDSGSVIVDGLGRIGGLLTVGAGTVDSSDITYATPISFLLKCMGSYGFKPNLNPTI